MNTLELLDRFNIRYVRDHKDVRAGFVGLPCKFCHHAGYYLGVNIAKGYAACWACGPHSIASILVAYGNVSWPEAIAAAKGVARLPAEVRPQGVYKPPAGVGGLQEAHRAYLRGRGLDPDAMAALWGLGGIGIAGRLAWSIFIPVVRHGVPVSWTCRSLGDKWRYHAAAPGEEAWPAKSLLGGADHARHAVIVEEGPFDVFNTGPGAVWTGGLGHTPAQVLAIAAYPIRAICFDNEPAAQIRARKLLEDLAPFDGVTHNICLDAKDPGSAPKKEIAALRRAVLD